MANIEDVIALVQSRKGLNTYTQDSTLRAQVFDGYSDCSSLMWKCFERGAGMQIGTYTDAQFANGNLVYRNTNAALHTVPTNIQTSSGMKRGDLIFWAARPGSGRVCSHVEMYLGNNRIIGHGSGIGPTEKTLSTYNHPYQFLGIRRYIESEAPVADYVTGNFWLNSEQQFTNAYYLYGALTAEGWSLEAICGLLGNTQIESTHNPGIYQDLNPDHPQPWGYGLVQWTPYDTYWAWCDENGYAHDSMEGAIARFKYEMDNGLQYYPTAEYPETFAEYIVSTKEPEYLAYAWLNNYERPGDRDQPLRQQWARYWYEQFQGLTPPDPNPPTPVFGNAFPIWMYLRRKPD